MKIYLVDVNNAVGMAHYETFFYKNIKQGNIAVFDKPIESLSSLDEVLTWIREDINRNPFSIDQGLVIFLIPRRLAQQRTPKDLEIYSQMYINQLLERHLDHRFKYLCFYMDDTGMESINDRIYMDIDAVNAAFSSDDVLMRSSFLPRALPPGDPEENVRDLIGELPDKTASDFYCRVLDEIDAAKIEGEGASVPEKDWYVNMFLRTCQDFISSVNTFRGAFFTGDIEQKIVTSLKVVKYLCDFADNYDSSQDFDVQLTGFINEQRFRNFSVDMDEVRQLIVTYKDRLINWKPPELVPDGGPIETFEYDCQDHSREFAEKLKEVSTEDLRSALEPSAKELSEFDLQGKVFSSMDTLIQDVRQILREFCESRIKEMRDFIDASVPAEPDRADGIKLLEDEINKERSSADAMDKYIQNELPGYPAELKLRQELDLIGRNIRRIGGYLRSMKILAFLLTLIFGVVSVGGYYIALQNTVFEKEDTWKVFGAYTGLFAVLFSSAWASVRVYYNKMIRKELKRCFDLVMEYLQTYIDRAKEFESNLNAAMVHFCNVDENNKKTVQRMKHTDFKRRMQWHRMKIRTILNNLAFFDVFVRGVQPVSEKGVPELKEFEHDAVHSDFYQMKIYR